MGPSIIHCVHWGINSPPQKHSPPSFSPSPPLNMQTDQALPFYTVLSYILGFCEPHLLKIGFFSEPHNIEIFHPSLHPIF